ncbi:MAG TPA: GAP family protein [Caldilineaceae bacterium]|nr:GAP family protein [Caldilineaceae bacterium]
MYGIIGTLLPFALGIAISPVSIIAVILLLTGNRTPAKGLAYLAGWLAGLITLFFVMLLLLSGRGYNRAGIVTPFTTWIMLIAGIILLVMAYLQWRQRPPPESEILPLEWLRSIPHTNSFMALSAGLFFSLFSMKNLLIVTATAALIGEAGLELDARAMAIAMFVAVATLGIAAPTYVVFTRGERATTILDDWECKLSIYNVTITCIVLVAIALQLLSLGMGRLL